MTHDTSCLGKSALEKKDLILVLIEKYAQSKLKYLSKGETKYVIQCIAKAK